MIFRCSNIAVMMASSTRISQITPSLCCGSCCYQDREWALTFEVTFKVWLQHQSCQHLSRRDICFCSSARKKSVGFYGSSFVKVKEDIYIFWSQRLQRGLSKWWAAWILPNHMCTVTIGWPDPWHQKAGHSIKLSLEKGNRIAYND